MALGHPYWGRLAYNLAMSIKFSSPGVDITVLFSEAALSHVTDRAFFTAKLVPVEYYTTNGRVCYLKAKTAVYKLSPYKETIFLDADTIWTPRRPITHLFDELKDIDFTMANRSFVELDSENPNDSFGVWAKPGHIKELFGFKEGRFYNLSSEMIYFKKKREVGKLFTDAGKYFDNKDIEHKNFNGGMPDELPFTISMIKNGLYPHIDNYAPIYWEAGHKPPRRLTTKEVNGEYAYSMGGNVAHPIMKKNYDIYVQFYCNQFNIRHPFKWNNKRHWLPGRATL